MIGRARDVGCSTDTNARAVSGRNKRQKEIFRFAKDDNKLKSKIKTEGNPSFLASELRSFLGGDRLIPFIGGGTCSSVSPTSPVTIITIIPSAL